MSKDSMKYRFQARAFCRDTEGITDPKEIKRLHEMDKKFIKLLTDTAGKEWLQYVKDVGASAFVASEAHTVELDSDFCGPAPDKKWKNPRWEGTPHTDRTLKLPFVGGTKEKPVRLYDELDKIMREHVPIWEQRVEEKAKEYVGIYKKIKDQGDFVPTPEEFRGLFGFKYTYEPWESDGSEEKPVDVEVREMTRDEEIDSKVKDLA